MPKFHALLKLNIHKFSHIMTCIHQPLTIKRPDVFFPNHSDMHKDIMHISRPFYWYIGNHLHCVGKPCPKSWCMLCRSLTKVHVLQQSIWHSLCLLDCLLLSALYPLDEVVTLWLLSMLCCCREVKRPVLSVTTSQ